MDRADESDRAQSQTLHSFVRDSVVKTEGGGGRGGRKERRRMEKGIDFGDTRLWERLKFRIDTGKGEEDTV